MDSFESLVNTFIYKFNLVFPPKITSRPKPFKVRHTNVNNNKSWFDAGLRKLKTFIVLIYDLYKSAKSPCQMYEYYNIYLGINRLVQKKSK